MNNVFSLQEVFAGKVLQIPDYQRGYAWEEQQWNELLEDLEFLAAKKDHYTGSLVLHNQPDTVFDKNGQRNEVFHIVDGQQRLATTVLLLDAIREKLTPFDKELADGTRSAYIEFKARSGQAAHKLRLNADCHDFFVHNVLGDHLGPQGPTIASHQKLRDAREHFRTYLNEKEQELANDFEPWLINLHEKVTQHLKIGQYIVGDSTEVGVIFEVMNNRGKQLSELEKVKNYLLYVASKLDIEDHDLATKINAAWAEVFQRLMAAGLTSADHEDRFLRAHWLMAYDPARKGWAGSKSVKERFDLREFHRKHKSLLKQLHEYVRSLKDSVLAFAEIFGPQGANAFTAYQSGQRADLKRWATKLTRTGALSTFLPILMAVRLRGPIDADAYLEALKLCELYAFRVYRWGSKRADAGQTRLFRLGYELFHKETTLKQISKEMRRIAVGYYPDHVFEQDFQPSPEQNFYLWPGLRYFLYEYEEHLAKGRGVKMSWDDLQSSNTEKTIEHILPQQPKHPYWKKRFTAEACRRLTHSIGNLTLTFDNSAYGRKPYPEKRGQPDKDGASYFNSSLFMERKIAKDYEDWTEKAIQHRSRQIKKWALVRWQIDASDLDDASPALFGADEADEPSE